MTDRRRAANPDVTLRGGAVWSGDGHPQRGTGPAGHPVHGRAAPVRRGDRNGRVAHRKEGGNRIDGEISLEGYEAPVGTYPETGRPIGVRVNALTAPITLVRTVL